MFWTSRDHARVAYVGNVTEVHACVAHETDKPVTIINNKAYYIEVGGWLWTVYMHGYTT